MVTPVVSGLDRVRRELRVSTVSAQVQPEAGPRRTRVESLDSIL